MADPNPVSTDTSQPGSRVRHTSISRSRHTIAAMLSKKLGPEYLSSRQAGGGMRVTYIEGWRAIGLANEVFGYDGWSSEIKQLDIDFVDVNPDTGRISAGVTAIIKVTVHDCGSVHEDVGYGSIEGARTKGDALDKCKKEAITDGVKRALRNYGNLLGNCIYDKSHIQESSKIKAVRPKFNFSDIYRKDEYLTNPLPVPKTELPDLDRLPESIQAPVLEEDNLKIEEQQQKDILPTKPLNAKYSTILVADTKPQELDVAHPEGPPSSPPMSDPIMGLDSLCNDVDFDDCFVDDSGVALVSSPRRPADKKSAAKSLAVNATSLTTPKNNESVLSQRRTNTIDRSVSRPIARKGTEHEVITRKLGPSEDFVRAASPSLAPELGGFTSVKSAFKRSIQVDFSDNSKRSKSSIE